MNIKLIALDLDGTTLKNDHVTLSDKNRRAIKKAVEKGMIVVPATGRILSTIPKCIMELEGIRYMVTSNGASVIDLKEEKSLYTNLIAYADAYAMTEMLMKKGEFLQVYIEGIAYVQKSQLENSQDYGIPRQWIERLSGRQTVVEDMLGFMKEQGKDIEKINLPYVKCERYELRWKELLLLENVALTSSLDSNIEINNASANKADGLMHLCRHLNILQEEVMAVGDNNNDVEMLSFAKLGIAMANGTQEAKAVANEITGRNEEDGVAHAIEKHILSV